MGWECLGLTVWNLGLGNGAVGLRLYVGDMGLGIMDWGFVIPSMGLGSRIMD